MKWDVVIGLEIHAQLNTKSKLFCSCATSFGEEANKNTCPTCLGYPGALPVLNKDALEKAILTTHALNCQLSDSIHFDRKNYFYPDSPRAYQITQFYKPIGQNGCLEINSGSNESPIPKRVSIKELHLEDDAGKLVHNPPKNESYIDLNRAGTPLVEIVSGPDLSSPSEALVYFKTVKSILEYVGVSECNMERGDLRCDANVSIKPEGSQTLGKRCEIKNMNTFKGLQAALEYEISRQKKILESGEKVVSQTMTFDPVTFKTIPIREKEDASGYRYHPENDLPPFRLDKSFVETVKQKLPELPETKKKRFMKVYGLSDYDATSLTTDKKTALFFEEAVQIDDRDPKKICNWMMAELFSHLNEKNMNIDEIPIKPKHIVSLVRLINENKITGKIAKEIFPIMAGTGKDPSLIVEEKGIKTIDNEEELKELVDKVLQANPKAIEQYKEGETKVLGFLVGQVMRESKGQANPANLNKILIEKLNS